MIQDVNLDEWSINSLNNRDGQTENQNNCNEPKLKDVYQVPEMRDESRSRRLENDYHRPRPESPQNNINQDLKWMDKQHEINLENDHLKPNTGASQNSVDLGARPRAPVKPSAEITSTSKRKLSPNESTPTGRQRKLSTTAYNSPILRGAIETVDGSVIQLDQIRAPDFITGIGLLTLRENGNAPGDHHPQTPDGTMVRPNQVIQPEPNTNAPNPLLSTPSLEIQKNLD